MFWIDQISIPGVTLLLLLWPICNYFTKKSSNKNDNPKFFEDEPDIDHAFAKLPRSFECLFNQILKLFSLEMKFLNQKQA